LSTVDTLLVEKGAEYDLQFLEDNIWRVLKPGGTYFLISVVPLEGIEDIFGSYPWNIEFLGQEELGGDLEVMEAEKKNIAQMKKTGAASEDSPAQRIRQTGKDTALVHFYKLSKPKLEDQDGDQEQPFDISRKIEIVGEAKEKQ